MVAKLELYGQRFGSLVAFERIPGDRIKCSKWKCRCDCGKVVEVRLHCLRNNTTTSCGCHRRDKTKSMFTTHGLAGTRFHRIWTNMINRCSNQKNKHFKDYGGKGIQVCEGWRKFEGFQSDMYQSYLEHKEVYGNTNTTIDRIETDGNYCPENCKWATQKEQARNRSSNVVNNYKGESLTLIEFSEKYEIPYGLLRRRLNKGWSIDNAIETPIVEVRQ